MTWNTFDICNICSANQKTTTVSDHQHLISQLYYTLSEHTCYRKPFPFSIPIQKVCEHCLLKTNFLLTNLENRIIPVNPWHLYNMQTNPHSSNGNDDKQPLQEQHQYNCDCHECQIKFGSLPLLVQVIERQEKSKSTDQKEATSSRITNDSTNTTAAADLDAPSTSFAHTAVSAKKIMKCPHCSKTCTHRGDFNKHVRKHTGERPYNCDVCNKKFAHTSNLNRHLKVHSGDRPFACTVCNRKFNRKDKLALHKKTKRCKQSSEKHLQMPKNK